MKYNLDLQVNERGEIPLQAKQKIREILLTFSNKKVSFVIEKFKRKRSNEQNSYYWGVLIKILSDELGYEPAEIHELLKYKFLGLEEIKIKDTREKRIISTQSLSTVDFMLYIEQVQRWASTLNIYIPDPNEDMT